MKFKTWLLFFQLPLSSFVAGQTIGTFNSVQPTAQTQNLVLPVTHTFQRIIGHGESLTSGETIGGNLDFTGYVPIAGSSTNGYLSISSETVPASCAILSIFLDPSTKLWMVSSSGNVPFPFADVGTVRSFCAGTVTPNNRIMVCEESAATGDGNGDGYNDDGWIIEIDPATRTVINQDGTGGVDKLWAMGRQRHEDIVITPDLSVAYWSADDATYGYVYKFVPAVPGNFSSGTLYVLQTSGALGTGNWQLIANTTQADRNNTQSLSMSAGAYNFSRVEGIEIGPDGKLYFASATSGNIYRFRDQGTSVDELEVFVASTNYDVDGAGPFSPEPWGTGADNIAFDGEGNLWVLQDGDRSHIWVVGPDHTAANPRVRLFATTPAGSEPTGITFSPDYKYLFLSIQHPNNNSNPQMDAAGNSVVFNTSTTIVIARKENLGAVVLPMSLTSFEARQKNHLVELNWSVAYTDNRYFEIERSTDGLQFEVIGSDGGQKKAFHFTDRNLPRTDFVYYRLKERNHNGGFIYSDTKSFSIKRRSTIEHVFPLPVTDKLSMTYHATDKGSVQVSIVTAKGELVRRVSLTVNQGTNTLNVDTKTVTSGVYFLVVEQGDIKTTHPFIKQ